MADTDPVAVPSRGLSIRREQGADGAPVVLLEGPLRLADGERLWTELGRLAEDARLRIDLSGVSAADTGAIALVAGLLQRGESPVRPRIEGAGEAVAPLVELVCADEVCEDDHAPPCKKSVFQQVGDATVDLLRDLEVLLDFAGDLTWSIGQTLRRPATMRWHDVGRLLERVGADGLPIVGLITFLMGLILAFQAAVQLKQFGANIFVADLVGISIVRELGPLMTAIIVAGRTGAAFAAELGTMKVSEEIDALRTMGIDPARFLVLPRMVALLIGLPLLTVFGDAIGVFGGLVVGLTNLDLSLTAYLSQTQKAIDLWDVGTGLIKSVVFAVTICLISCERGLATRGGAEGVGRSTTSAVVTILFTLVMLDFVFTLLFDLFQV